MTHVWGDSRLSGSCGAVSLPWMEAAQAALERADRSSLMML